MLGEHSFIYTTLTDKQHLNQTIKQTNSYGGTYVKGPCNALWT